MPEPLKVRGICPKCRRVVDERAPKGKATWRGSCPAGCGATVVARRVRDVEPPKAEPAQTKDTPPATAGRQKRKVVKADGYATPPAKPQRGADVRRTPAARPAGPAQRAPERPADEPGPEPRTEAEPQPVRKADAPEHRRRSVLGGYADLY